MATTLENYLESLTASTLDDTADEFLLRDDSADADTRVTLAQLSTYFGADLVAHEAETTDAHDASAISIADAGALYTATNVEAALAEVRAVADLGGGGEGGAIDSVNGATGVVVLDADDIDDTSTTHKFATAAQLSAVDGLGTASTAATGDFATAAQGVLADAALPEADVDADIKTLSLPASTTISAFGASLIDDADAGTALTTLGAAAAADVAEAVQVTAAEYAALTPDSGTIYYVVG